MTIVSLRYHSRLSLSARAKHHFCSLFLRGPGEDGPNSLQTQDLEQEFRSWDLQAAHKCFASPNGQIIIKMRSRSVFAFFFFSYLNVGKGCASTLLDPHGEKPLQSGIALPNIISIYVHTDSRPSWKWIRLIFPISGVQRAGTSPTEGPVQHLASLDTGLRRHHGCCFALGRRFSPLKFLLASSPFPIQSWHPPPSDLSGVPSALQTPFFFSFYNTPQDGTSLRVYYSDAVPATTIMALS